MPIETILGKILGTASILTALLWLLGLRYAKGYEVWVYEGDQKLWILLPLCLWSVFFVLVLGAWQIISGSILPYQLHFSAFVLTNTWISWLIYFYTDLLEDFHSEPKWLWVLKGCILGSILYG